MTTNSEIYDSSRRSTLSIEEIREIYKYRNLILQLTRRDILTRYKRSLLGIAWTMLNPLGMMLILSIVFSHVFGTTPAYPAYILSGLIAWNFFSQTTTASIVNLVWGGGLLHRVYIPRTAFAIAAIGTGIVNLVLSIVPLIIVMVIIGLPIHVTIAFLPISILLLAMFSLGIGLFLSAFAVYFPDVAEMYQIILIAWMYLSPIIYPLSQLPQNIRQWVILLNPMVPILNLFRKPVYEGLWPTINDILPALVIAVVVLIGGWLFFTTKADEFSYRI